MTILRRTKKKAFARTKQGRLASRFWGCLALAALGCSAVNDGDDDAGKTSQPIFHGVEWEEEESGFVRLQRVANDAPAGTGTLLKNNWVLTAAHCVNLDIDHKFANGGFWSGTTSGEVARAVVLTSASKVVYAGGATIGSSNLLLVGMLTAASPAAPDTSFDGDGKRAFDVPGSTSETLNAVALQSDGKIVGAGWVTVSGKRQFLVVRFNTNGSLDTTFDSDGYVMTDFDSATSEQASAILIDPTGKIIVGGEMSDATTSSFALARYGSTGALDTTFSGDGKVSTSFGASAQARVSGITRLGDGGIVVAGPYSDSSSTKVAVAKYGGSNGALDTSFSSDGKHTLGTSATGGAVVAGASNAVFVGGKQGTATIWKLKANGSLDTTFGSSGSVSPTFLDNSNTQVVALARSNSGTNRVRAAVRSVNSANNSVQFSLSSFPEGGPLLQDRFYPEITGQSYASSGATLNAIATNSADRVVMVGTMGVSSSSYRPAVLSLYPDRTLFQNGSGLAYPLHVRMGDEVRTVTNIHYPTGTNAHTLDVALVKLSQGFTMAGSTTGYSFFGWSTLAPPRDVTCNGYGSFEFDANGNPSGDDILRAGASRWTSTDTNYAILKYLPNYDTQLPWFGDSGGSCWDSQRKLHGVISRSRITVGNPSTDETFLVPQAKFSSWANTTMQTL